MTPQTAAPQTHSASSPDVRPGCVTPSPPEAGPSPVAQSSPDGDLVAQACAGRREAFDLLVRRYLGLVHAVALAHLRDRDAADDLAQETFLRAYLALGDLAQPERFGPWVARIARNLALDWLRAGRRRSQALPLVPFDDSTAQVADPQQRGALEQMQATEETRALQAAIAALDAEDREIVLLHFAHDLATPEIAARLGVHRATVRRRLDRAIAALRAALSADLAPAVRRATSALRPVGALETRTLAVVGAVALLSTQAKAALAAQAGGAAVVAAATQSVATWGAAGVPGAAGATGATGLAGAAGIAQGIAAAWHTLWSGGIFVSVKTQIAAVVAAVALIGGVTYHELTRAPAAPVAPAGQAATPPAASVAPGETKEVTLLLPGDVPLVLVRIPAGTFQMGSPEVARSVGGPAPREPQFETPQHTVTIGYDLYMGKTEVTQAQWEALMGGNPSFFQPPTIPPGLDLPVDNVSWNDIATTDTGFLARLNQHLTATGQAYSLGLVRLPSESEWEYACRAGTTTRWFFGDSLAVADENADGPAEGLPGNRSDYMWFSANREYPNGGGGTHSVATKRPNRFGLYDMSGNICEWCQDRFFGFYDRPGAPTDGSPWERDYPGRDELRRQQLVMMGESESTEYPRVFRGGSSFIENIPTRSAGRAWRAPDGRMPFVGFRVACMASARPRIGTPPSRDELRKYWASIPSGHVEWTLEYTGAASVPGRSPVRHEGWFARPDKFDLRTTQEGTDGQPEGSMVSDGETLLIRQAIAQLPWQRTDLRRLRAASANLDVVWRQAVPWFPLGLLASDRLTTNSVAFVEERMEAERGCYLYEFEDREVAGKCQLIVDRATLLPVQMTAPLKMRANGREISAPAGVVIDCRVDPDAPVPADAFRVPAIPPGQPVVDATSLTLTLVANPARPASAAWPAS